MWQCTQMYRTIYISSMLTKKSDNLTSRQTNTDKEMQRQKNINNKKGYFSSQGQSGDPAAKRLNINTVGSEVISVALRSEWAGLGLHPILSCQGHINKQSTILILSSPWSCPAVYNRCRGRCISIHLCWHLSSCSKRSDSSRRILVMLCRSSGAVDHVTVSLLHIIELVQFYSVYYIYVVG